VVLSERDERYDHDVDIIHSKELKV